MFTNFKRDSSRQEETSTRVKTRTPTPVVPPRRVIALTGKKGSGKNAAADYIAQVFHNVPVFQYAFADPLKESAIHLFGLQRNDVYGSFTGKERVLPEWGKTPRQLLQALGDTVRNELGQHFGNVFLIGMRNKIVKEFRADPDAMIIITDLRYQDELNLVKELGGVVVGVTRSIERVPDLHSSENQTLPCDVCVDNNGTLPELYAELDTALRRLGFS